MGRKEGSKNITLTVKRLITWEALQKPPKPRRALAIELMGKIERMGEVVPTEETIERLISEVLNHEPNPLDEPWSAISLLRYPIPPEALPSILQAWVLARERGEKFTIRNAQWVARFYATTKDISHLATISRLYTASELISDITGQEAPTHSVDLQIWGEMTGQEITPEREKRILGLSDEEWVVSQKAGEDFLRKIFAGEEPEFMKNMSSPQRQKEAQNERPHNKEG